jgi:hypothetical protein
MGTEPRNERYHLHMGSGGSAGGSTRRIYRGFGSADLQSSVLASPLIGFLYDRSISAVVAFCVVAELAAIPCLFRFGVKP